MNASHTTRVFDGQPTLPADARGAVFAMGNFDGVHPGHRGVIERARAEAIRLNAPLGVIVFEPLPYQFFHKDTEPFRLTTPAQRRRLLADLGVDILVERTFNQDLAALSAREFCENVLTHELGARCLTVGYDFNFGRARTGNTESLRSFGEEFGFDVVITAEVTDRTGQKASSSRIRAALKDGDVALAAQLLGRPWEIEGVVEHGEKRGRTIGYPTANLRLGSLIHPRFGVYAVSSAGDDGVWRPGVANFGRTPTTGERDPLLEVHLFDFDGDLYGQNLRTRMLGFLRDEAKFDSLDAMVAQISKDAEAARAILSRDGSA
jgi:riboflavin kinase / FMN adenylyltransferase